MSEYILKQKDGTEIGRGESARQVAEKYHADLLNAHLLNADLRNADLHGIRHAYSSHDLIAEILRQAAGDNAEHRAYAGLVAVSKDWCWEQFHELNHPGRDWAYGVLVDAAHEDDELPRVLVDFKASITVESEGE